MYYYTKSYLNLGSTASQRGESYHSMVREITSGQLSFKDSGKVLSKKVLSIYKDLDTHEHASLRGYSRLGQLYRDVFLYLRCIISKFGMEKIQAEWKRLKQMLQEHQGRYF